VWKMPSAVPDAPTGADMEGKPSFHPRPLRIRGRTFLRSVGTVRPLPAEDETGSAHGANPWRRLCGRRRQVSQKPFVCVAAATDSVAAASDLV
jgi:hypothetical protein